MPFNYCPIACTVELLILFATEKVLYDWHEYKTNTWTVSKIEPEERKKEKLRKIAIASNIHLCHSQGHNHNGPEEKYYNVSLSFVSSCHLSICL